MRALRTCEFCETTAVGTFELLPPELKPTEAEQRRVVLCSDCKDHLEHLLEPLLARAGSERPAETHEADLEPEPEQRRDNASEESDSDSSTTDTATTPAQTDSSNELDDGITFTAAGDAATENAAVDAATADSATSTANDSVSSVDTGATDADQTSDSDEPTESDSRTNEDDKSKPNTTEPRPPQAYSKVIRLLRNRDLPMERTAVEALASGAYDLESDDVAEILDHAVENGEFHEENGELRRP
ncbi:hypothetical protein G6M89_07595 [Natronolimnobius sp. AArcel1]|uniref:hypothetical protein n=1 Tax=Natronolimnobius sp. AArcel1 TaxID=1679093 RepID=UPI0013ED66AB|nr:hypothetical protein [Natronolimnobius sp. AArcel1]NGM68875.1 hypothetical protein [Natronolimnobius sp. AArcel1]